MERGAKTTSDSYILWPARVGAFSLVMGRHVNHADTSNLPFSYLIEQKNTTYLVPGVNLRSVGTIRDAQKWPKRDKRTDENQLDYINYNLLSPYTVQKMFKGRDMLMALRQASGELSDTYSYQSAKIKNSSLKNGIRFYEIAIHSFWVIQLSNVWKALTSGMMMKYVPVYARIRKSGGYFRFDSP